MELLNIGAPGFGPRQMLMTILGLALLALPAWFGLFIGFAEVAHRLLFKYGSMFPNIPLDFVWIAPLSYMGVFVALDEVFAIWINTKLTGWTAELNAWILDLLGLPFDHIAHTESMPRLTGLGDPDCELALLEGAGVVDDLELSGGAIF